MIEPRAANNSVETAHGGGVVNAQDLDGESDAKVDGSSEIPEPHAIRFELVDGPGQLLAALKPTSDNDENLLSIFHERGSLTPRGHIPVKVDLGYPPDHFARIVEALRDAGVNTIRAGAEHFGEEVMIILVGDIVDSDLPDTLHRIEPPADATFQDLSLSAREGTNEVSNVRLRLTVRSGRVDETFGVVRDIATEKELHVIEPLAEGSQ